MEMEAMVGPRSFSPSSWYWFVNLFVSDDFVRIKRGGVKGVEL